MIKSLDLFLNSVSEQEYLNVKASLPQIKNSGLPIISGDLFLNNFHSFLNTKEIENEVLNIKKIGKSFSWKTNFETILNKNSFEALVITDVSEKIIWVNNGFSKMTGYSKKHALNKTPSFLQGEKTSNKNKAIIRKKLNSGESFKQTVLNYKKNNSSYKCEVHIFPLLNSEGETTHFLALEKEVA